MGDDGFGHRVVATRPEGPAAEQPAHGEPQATDRTVGLERFDCVAGAARGEPTGGGPTLEGTLVGLDGADHPARPHTVGARVPGGGVHVAMRARSLSRSVSSSANDRPATPGVAPIRYKPAGRRVCRSCRRARRRRRSRLRVTAGPTARPMAYATCGGETRGSSTNVHHRTPARTREPVRAIRSNEDRPRTLPIKRTDGDGPWPDGTSARRGRPWCSSGRGSRASWLAASCWVERCASTQTSSDGSTIAAETQTRTGAWQQGRPRQNHARLRVEQGIWQPRVGRPTT
ncbi:MAG: hypothetical protein JWM34_2665 [Ilumatobacteraceae bacterium]|nr:hypothetical protein [Ilumatobacteraceae bacterium]